MWNDYRIDWTEESSMVGGDLRDAIAIINSSISKYYSGTFAALYFTGEEYVTDKNLNGVQNVLTELERIILNTVNENSPYPVFRNSRWEYNVWESVEDFINYYALEEFPTKTEGVLISLGLLIKIQRILMKIGYYVGTFQYQYNIPILTMDNNLHQTLMYRFSGNGYGASRIEAYNNAIANAINSSPVIAYSYYLDTSVSNIPVNGLYSASVVTTIFKLNIRFGNFEIMVYEPKIKQSFKFRVLSFDEGSYPIEDEVSIEKVNPEERPTSIQTEMVWLPIDSPSILLHGSKICLQEVYERTWGWSL